MLIVVCREGNDGRIDVLALGLQAVNVSFGHLSSVSRADRLTFDEKPATRNATRLLTILTRCV